mmetsp:Transcript_24551/g.75844  ORF Transcript_24551/g.75844 Transcript_24551/m.75844 type:complete len:214 (+) Transcript_24551:1028-1669(+)
MAADGKTNRKLSILESEDVSPAFDLAVKGDFAGEELSGGETRGSCSLERALDAIRRAFDKEDLLLNVNLVPVAIHFLEAVEHLPTDLGLQEELEKELRKVSLGVGHCARRSAAHSVVSSDLLGLQSAEYFGQGPLLMNLNDGKNKRMAGKEKKSFDAAVARVRGKGDSDDVRQAKLDDLKERATIFLNRVSLRPADYRLRTPGFLHPPSSKKG